MQRPLSLSRHPGATPPGAPPVANAAGPVTDTGDAVLHSADLLGARQAVEIEHNGQRYRLQATRQGKLILTK